MASRHLLRRITARTTRCQESAEKNYSKNYQASRICREELQQELPGVKNPPRRITARNTRCQESAKKNYSKKYQASRICREEDTEEANGVKTPAEKKSSPGGGVVFKTLGPALVVFERSVHARCEKLKVIQSDV